MYGIANFEDICLSLACSDSEVLGTLLLLSISWTLWEVGTRQGTGSKEKILTCRFVRAKDGTMTPETAPSGVHVNFS